ncbi:MAG: rRNA maturation RNase YbeY [Pseudomonadota bacterium]
MRTHWWIRKTSAMALELQLADALDPGTKVPAQTRFDGWLDGIRLELSDPRLSRDICVRLCDAEESAALNGNYRDKPYATNVLSFPAGDAHASLPLGDLAICLPVVAAEAVEQGKRMEDHLAHLFVHGTLHLLGFDHEDAHAAQEMERLEVAILARLRIADPYHS